MNVTLPEIKNFLRVDTNDDDALLTNMLADSRSLCAYAARKTEDEVSQSSDECYRAAILFAVAYRYEHREQVDYNYLMTTLRAILMPVRGDAF